VLPSRPANIGELSEADMEKVAGASLEVDPALWVKASALRSVAATPQTPGVISKVVSGVSAVIASGIGSLIAGENIDTGW
jgi:hypothetical protein